MWQIFSFLGKIFSHTPLVTSAFVSYPYYFVFTRLQGITKSISRYPTAKRRFDGLVKSLSEELEKKIGISISSNGSSNNGSSHIRRLRSGISRMISQKSIGRTLSIQGEDKGGELDNDVISPV